MKIVLYGLLCIFQYTIFTEAKRQARIIDGNNVRIEDYPHQVSIRKILGYNHGQEVLSHWCGGSIVSERHIVTAAHCFENTQPEQIKVVSGTSRSDILGQSHSVKKITPHPEYSASNPRVYNDIAVLTLSEPIEFSPTQQPIDLPKPDAQSKPIGTIIGWGQLPSTGKFPINLQATQMFILSAQECMKMKSSILMYTQLCGVSFQSGLTGGDSGGPLIAGRQLVGVASAVIEKGARNTDVFTNVYPFMKFINDTMEST